ncbi:MAG: GtrA family protein [Gammaproteobacteria bacterium]|nr:GtrA family protein [Gammaproteobacteria bacterium]
MKIALMYTIFAVFATAANIAGQDLTIRIYQGPFAIIASIFIGTAVGLVLKYGLDKRYIFKYQTQTLQQGSKTFTLYTLMGLITTVIFWGLELLFDALYGTKEMRYVGGIIGLAIGYFVKYQLDKKYVFK